MKCPKCDYLGFETGDRCRNCGYDFSLLAVPESDPVELSLKPPPQDEDSVGELWLDRPLFPPIGADDDEPLIKLPAEPRAPLSVRRTPDQPRLRTTAKAPRPVDAGLVLEFAEEAPTVPVEPDSVDEAPPPAQAPALPATARRDRAAVASLRNRCMAALTDHAILLGVDVVVVYGTLRMTALTMSDWRALPLLPFLSFLVLLKLAYFSAFTAIGGQTIGKMAAGIRVVADDPLRMDPGRAIRRTLTGAVSLLSLGLGLIPALLGPERRALHDRVAHTRVVDLPSA